MSGEPELVPRTPIVVGGRVFDPKQCNHDSDTHGDETHYCVHDWRRYWGNQKRER